MCVEQTVTEVELIELVADVCRLRKLISELSAGKPRFLYVERYDLDGAMQMATVYKITLDVLIPVVIDVYQNNQFSGEETHLKCREILDIQAESWYKINEGSTTQTNNSNSTKESIMSEANANQANTAEVATAAKGSWLPSMDSVKKFGLWVGIATVAGGIGYAVGSKNKSNGEAPLELTEGAPQV